MALDNIGLTARNMRKTPQNAECDGNDRVMTARRVKLTTFKVRLHAERLLSTYHGLRGVFYRSVSIAFATATGSAAFSLVPARSCGSWLRGSIEGTRT